MCLEPAFRPGGLGVSVGFKVQVQVVKKGARATL